jgi:hypothetical protein
VKSLVLCNLISWSSHNSTYGTFDPLEKLSILMETCFSEDIMPAVKEGSVINNTIMCLDLLDANSACKLSLKKTGKHHQFWSQSISC